MQSKTIGLYGVYLPNTISMVARIVCHARKGNSLDYIGVFSTSGHQVHPASGVRPLCFHIQLSLITSKSKSLGRDLKTDHR